MTFIRLLLLVHLLGAAVAALCVVGTVCVLAVKKTTLFRHAAVLLTIATVWQLVSGALLSLATVKSGGIVSAQTYCQSLSLYVAVLATTQYALYQTMRRRSMAFPSRLVVSSATVALSIVIVVGVQLFAHGRV